MANRIQVRVYKNGFTVLHEAPYPAIEYAHIS